MLELEHVYHRVPVQHPFYWVLLAFLLVVVRFTFGRKSESKSFRMVLYCDRVTVFPDRNTVLYFLLFLSRKCLIKNILDLRTCTFSNPESELHQLQEKRNMKFQVAWVNRERVPGIFSPLLKFTKNPPGNFFWRGGAWAQMPTEGFSAPSVLWAEVPWWQDCWRVFKGKVFIIHFKTSWVSTGG